MSTQNDYNIVPYSSKPHRGRHPDRLATISHLLGHKAPAIETSKVIELGCSNGLNLISLASLLPDAEFFGIDSSTEQIQQGNRLISELGLRNVTLEVVDIANYATTERRFDYVFSHGVYSWVSEGIRDGLMRVISEALSPNGLACVSYNTLPGWHIRRIVREFLLFHDNRSETPTNRTKKGREVLELLQRSTAFDFERPYSILLHKELDRIKGEPDSYLLHEFLAEVNDPVYFSEFASHAAKYNLQILGDARFQRMAMNRLFSAEIPSDAFKGIIRLSPDQVSLEQNMDFLFNGVFRESILCRENISLHKEISPEAVQGCSIASMLKYDPESDSYIDPRGPSVEVSNKLFRAALDLLHENFPNYIPFSRLLRESRKRGKPERASSDSDAQASSALTGAILEWYQRDLVDLTLSAPELPLEVPDRPRASKFSRLISTQGTVVVNNLHNSVEIGELEAAFLAMCDGSHNLEDFLAKIVTMIESGQGGIREGGEPVTDINRQRELARELVMKTLETLRQAALIIP